MTETTEQLEIREFAVRLAEPETDKREFTGIAVPWDTVADIAGLYEERIARGAVQDSDDAKVWWRHAEPIGRITRAEDTEAGWQITGVLSATPRGEEAYTLLRDGVVDRLSIGFLPLEHTDETHDDGSITRTRTRIKVREVSIVPLPAYSGAAVTQVREARTEGDTPMSDTLTRADLDEVRSSIEDLDRELKLVGSQVTATAPEGDQFRSFGEYVKAVAAGDEAALRAYTGATTGDTVIKDGWVGDVIRLGQERQRITKLFRHTFDLPAEGNNVEYGVLLADTTAVDVQAKEGDDLVYGKVTLETKTAPVVTLGGWAELSRQAIERTTVSVLDFTFQAMYLKYARAVEALTRAALTAAYNDATAANKLARGPRRPDHQDGVVEGLIDLVEHFDDQATTLSGLLVAKDVFLSLLAVPATDRILQVTQAPTDKFGTLTVSASPATSPASRSPCGPTPRPAPRSVTTRPRSAPRSPRAP